MSLGQWEATESFKLKSESLVLFGSQGFMEAIRGCSDPMLQ